MNMKMDQIAFYCNTDLAELMVKNAFGLADKEWVQDYVIGDSSVFGGPFIENKAHLQFNYDLGIEIELLRYVEGPHWHTFEVDERAAFISHIGVHLDANEPFPDMGIGWSMVQETFTKSHTNAFVNEKKRKYHYQIFRSYGTKTYIKFIKRIEGEA